MNSHKSVNENDSIEIIDRDNMSARKINLSSKEIEVKQHANNYSSEKKSQSNDKKL